jgi:hypothetical protein
MNTWPALDEYDEIPIEGAGQFLRTYERDAVVIISVKGREHQLLTYGYAPEHKDYAARLREFLEPHIQGAIGADGPAQRVNDTRAQKAYQQGLAEGRRQAIQSEE